MHEVKPLTPAQEDYAKRHCFKSVAFLRKKGMEVICSECGTTFHPGEIGRGKVTCPFCFAEIDPHTNHRKTVREKAYYLVPDTVGRFQVLRWFLVETCKRAGQPAYYEHYEVSQIWFSPDGQKVRVERNRVYSCYVDTWSRYGTLDIRVGSSSVLDHILPYAIYDRGKIIPELKRRGYKGGIHGIAPIDLVNALLTNPNFETLYKAGQYALCRHFICSNAPIGHFWPSIKICLRNGYKVEDGSLWCDLVTDLRYLGKDLTSPHYVCPANLKTAHDEWVRIVARKSRKEAAERRKLEALRCEEQYKRMRHAFFGLLITDGKITLKVLQSVSEFWEEAKEMHHCVYESRYYKKPTSLILSAKIDGKRIETVEVSLETFDVVQSRGVCNSNSRYHNRILKLVRENMHQIRKCANAA